MFAFISDTFAPLLNIISTQSTGMMNELLERVNFSSREMFSNHRSIRLGINFVWLNSELEATSEIIRAWFEFEKKKYKRHMLIELLTRLHSYCHGWLDDVSHEKVCFPSKKIYRKSFHSLHLLADKKPANFFIAVYKLSSKQNWNVKLLSSSLDSRFN